MIKRVILGLFALLLTTSVFAANQTTMTTTNTFTNDQPTIGNIKVTFKKAKLDTVNNTVKVVLSVSNKNRKSVDLIGATAYFVRGSATTPLAKTARPYYFEREDGQRIVKFDEIDIKPARKRQSNIARISLSGLAKTLKKGDKFSIKVRFEHDDRTVGYKTVSAMITKVSK